MGCALRCLVVHEMTNTLRGGSAEVREGLPQTVHPFSLEHRVALAPVHAGRDVDGRWRWNAPLPYGPSGRTIPEIPVETTLKIPRLHEVVDEAVEVLVKGVLVSRPVAKYVADVETTGLARRTDHRRRPG